MIQTLSNSIVITTLEQFGSIVKQNPLYLASSTTEYIGEHYKGIYEIDMDSEELEPALDQLGQYIITYDNIEDLIKFIEDSEKYITNLWDCGDDDFFDNKPDLVHLWYRALYLIKTNNALSDDRINCYIDIAINSIQEVLHLSSMGEVPNDLDKLYKNLELNFSLLSK